MDYGEMVARLLELNRILSASLVEAKDVRIELAIARAEAPEAALLDAIKFLDYAVRDIAGALRMARELAGLPTTEEAGEEDAA